MQLYAFDKDKNLVFAKRAIKQQDYFCIECLNIVRLRSGIHRQVHFYHLASSHSCRLNGKSMEHLQIQLKLQEMLPEGQSQIEHRFQKINRIADVCWEKEKIIFEIQCSPISAQEVSERNKDYASEGYRVVWILHDFRFNQWRLTAAEHVLQRSTHYYTNIKADGLGDIYDQLISIKQGRKNNVVGPLPISLHIPKAIPLEAQLPECLKIRVQYWQLSFHGDLLQEYAKEEIAQRLDTHFDKPKNPKSYLVRMTGFVARMYHLLFQMLLERACK